MTSADPAATPASASYAAARTSRTVRWALALGALAVCAIAVGLLFLLLQATNQRALYEHEGERYGYRQEGRTALLGFVWTPRL